MTESTKFMKGQMWYWEDPIYGPKSKGMRIPIGENTMRYSRYVVIIQDSPSPYDNSILVVPCTSKGGVHPDRRFEIPIHIQNTFSEDQTYALVDRLHSVHVKLLQRYVCTLSNATMAKINGAIVKLIIPELVTNVIEPNLQASGIDVSENYDHIETENYDVSMREFIEKHIRYTVNPNDVVTIWELKKAYDNFCIIHGYRPMYDMIQFLDVISRFTTSKQLNIPHEPWLMGDHGFSKVKIIGNLDTNITIAYDKPESTANIDPVTEHDNEESAVTTDVSDNGIGDYTDKALRITRGSNGRIIWDQAATDQYRKLRHQYSAEEFAKLYKVSPSTIAKYDLLFIKKGQMTSSRKSQQIKVPQEENIPQSLDKPVVATPSSKKFNTSSPITITSNEFRDALTFLTTLICNDISALHYFEVITAHIKSTTKKSPKNRTIGDFKYSIRNAVSNSIMKSLGVTKRNKMYIIPDFPKRKEDTPTWEMIFWIHLRLSDLKNKSSKDIMKMYYESQLGLNVGLSKDWIGCLKQSILDNVKHSRKDENLQSLLDEISTIYCQR